MQNERAEQLRSLSFLAGILLSFSMAALYQLIFEDDAFDGGPKIIYSLTIALSVRLCTSSQSALPAQRFLRARPPIAPSDTLV